MCVSLLNIQSLSKSFWFHLQNIKFICFSSVCLQPCPLKKIKYGLLTTVFKVLLLLSLSPNSAHNFLLGFSPNDLSVLVFFFAWKVDTNISSLLVAAFDAVGLGLTNTVSREALPNNSVESSLLPITLHHSTYISFIAFSTACNCLVFPHQNVGTGRDDAFLPVLPNPEPVNWRG